jgi:phage tail-like protein
MGGGEYMDRKVIFAVVAATIFSLSVSAAVIAPGGPRNDPLPDSKFRVEIDGLVSSSFAEVSGIRLTTDVIEYRDGTDINIRYLPGLNKVGDITLKRGVTGDSDLWDWYEEVRSGADARKNMAVIIMDHGRIDRVRYTFEDCFPIVYEGPSLDSTPGDIAYESLTLQCEQVYFE